FEQLLLLPIPEVDLPGVVFQLEGERAVPAVMREGGMALGGGAGRRAGLAQDLPAGDPVMFVEENVGMLVTVAVGGEGDEELGTGRVLRGQRAREPEANRKEHDEDWDAWTHGTWYRSNQLRHGCRIADEGPNALVEVGVDAQQAVDRRREFRHSD